jgi:hypothetical protein
MCKKGRNICWEKSKDYAKDANVFHNFEKCERDSICDTETGFLVRLSDKQSRLPNVIRQGNTVKDETVIDTIIDEVNYMLLLAAYLVSRKGVKCEFPDQAPPLPGMEDLVEPRLPDVPHHRDNEELFKAPNPWQGPASAEMLGEALDKGRYFKDAEVGDELARSAILWNG